MSVARVSEFKAFDVWIVVCYVIIFAAFLEYEVVNFEAFSIYLYILYYIMIDYFICRVSEFKAIDVWMVVCYVFIFAAFLEYAVVNVLARHVALDSDGKPVQKTAKSNKVKPLEKSTEVKQVESIFISLFF